MIVSIGLKVLLRSAPFFFTQHGFVLLLKLACITGAL